LSFKVLFVIPTPLFPLGQSNYNSFKRIKELIQYDYSIKVVCPTINKKYSKEITDFKNDFNIEVLDNFQTAGLSGLRKHLRYILFNKNQFKSIITKTKPDIIHVVNPPDLIPLVVSGVAKKNKIPLVFHIADPGPESMATIFSGIKKHIFVSISKLIEKIVIIRSQALITVNGVLKEQIKKTRRVQNKNFIVVYNVHEAININKKLNQEIKMKNSLVYLGTLSSEMIGLKDFIYNYKKINGWANSIFHIIGDGPHRHELQQLSEEINLNKQIQFKGHLSFNKAIELVSSSALAILPYKNTPLTRIALPTKLFEYIGSSKAVVCPDLPGLKEILGKNYSGFYNADSFDDIYNTINELLKNEKMILRIEKENFQLSKKYKLNKEVKKIHSLYNSIIIND